MSGILVGKVYELQLPRLEKAVLLAMAENANDEGGNCFPGVKLLAWKTDYSERQVQRALRGLEQREIIAAVGHAKGGRGLTVEYQIDVAKGVKKSAFQGAKRVTSNAERVTFDAQKGDKADVKGDISSAPYKEIEPSQEPPVEPSHTPQKRRRAKKPQVALPDDFEVSEEMQDWANQQALAARVDVDVGRETEMFCDHAKSSGRTCADWRAAWRNWIRKGILMTAERRNGGRQNVNRNESASERNGRNLRDTAALMGISISNLMPDHPEGAGLLPPAGSKPS